MNDDSNRRRLRRRRGAGSGPDEHGDEHGHDHGHPVPKPPEPVHKPAPPADNKPAPPVGTTKPVENPPRADKSERSLRGLVGSGPSQVSVSAAMRARDAARPDAEDIAAAERDLTVVRRHYEPQESGPKPKKGKR